MVEVKEVERPRVFVDDYHIRGIVSDLLEGNELEFSKTYKMNVVLKDGAKVPITVDVSVKITGREIENLVRASRAAEEMKES